MSSTFLLPCLRSLCRKILPLIGVTFLPCMAFAAEAPLRVLILSGQNNHDWKTTTPKLESILSGSGRFAVELTEQPEKLDAAALAKYDALLSNWNAWGKTSDAWPEAARQAYLEFIRGGKGLVVVHAGSSSFYDWAEYQQAGGASWKLGETRHGAPHEFLVKPVDPQHPVMRGVEPFRTKDELWMKPGVQPGAKVLAVGDEQPVALATGFGKGRGFTLLLGHSAAFTENPGFQALLLRGTEWAASGVVTLNPQTGPDSGAVLRAVAAYRFGEDRAPVLALERICHAASEDPGKRKALAARMLGLVQGPAATLDGKKQILWHLSLLAGPEDAEALRKLVADRDFGYYAQNALARLAGSPARKTESELRAQDEASARAVAGEPGKLLAVLSGSDRGEQCRALAALRAAPDQAALQALVAGFDQFSAEMQVQVVALLGDCATPAGLPVLVKAAGNEDPLLRQTAFIALGRVGNESSVAPLVAALGTASAEERKLAGEALGRLGGSGVDAALVAALSKSAPDVQRELIRVLVVRESERAISALMSTARSGNAAVRIEAGAAIGRLGDTSLCAALLAMLDTHPDGASLALAGICSREKTVQPLLAAMAGAPVARKLVLLSVLGATGGSEALGALRPAVNDPDPAVRMAAVRSLASWPDGAAFEDLAALSANAADPASRTLAVRGLARLVPLADDLGPDQIAGTLSSVMGKVGAGERRTLLGALAKLSGPAALKAVETYANDPEVGAEAKAALEQIKAAATNSRGRKRLGSATEAQMKLFNTPENLCRGAKATSPTGLQPDGHGDVPAAAIDGDGGTYWDEVDKQALYRISVQLGQPATVALLRILGFQHQSYAPKTFEVLCDGKPVKQVEDAAYLDNVLTVELPPTECSTVELKITGCYGASPAIRELGVFPSKR